MALSLAQLQVMLDALKTARYTGSRVVTVTIGIERRSVEYKTDAEMVAAIKALEGDIATATGTSRTGAYIQFSTGLNAAGSTTPFDRNE